MMSAIHDLQKFWALSPKVCMSVRRIAITKIPSPAVLMLSRHAVHRWKGIVATTIRGYCLELEFLF